ncbi:phosphoribosylformylglycinamidine synthase subunit PurS [Garciella nitratireducens]|uniref:Phosphoribosylformylglycinamidine synthase subunit PurS n=1 Tax=Garciella nitratireducens DSM 15102 TaxID=1121911 RepID=A0A1T4NCW3_9FIRM|nr:phosphoribosylformylglycinamidine synthase subunit PurS [Garciella nitratireducens]SJZ77094.1 phosphoribosylformylglycinamidine synthase [Garciella nitratireducens DSM 15102]
MKAKVYVTLKKSISDPKGTAVKSSLNQLGFQEVKEVRMGKYIEIEMQDMPKEQAKETVQSMCKKLLANEVMETYQIEIMEGQK